MKHLTCLSLIFIGQTTFAQRPTLPVPAEKSSIAPHSEGYQAESEFQRRYEEIMAQEASLAEKEAKLQKLMEEYGTKTELPGGTVMNFDVKVPPPKPKPKRRAGPTRKRRESSFVEPLQIFYSESDVYAGGGTRIQQGSYVQGTLISGLDALPSELRPVLIELDGLVHKPNGEIFSLKGCRVIAKVKGDLSVERAIIQAKSLSCSNGDRDFSAAIDGFGVGTSEDHFGLKGEYESRQSRVFAAAVLAKLAEGAGKAVALANMNEVVATTEGGAVKSTNVNPGKTIGFAAAQSTADAGAMIAEWYLNEARKLSPYIKVVSGQRIWLVFMADLNVPEDMIEEL